VQEDPRWGGSMAQGFSGEGGEEIEPKTECRLRGKIGSSQVAGGSTLNSARTRGSGCPGGVKEGGGGGSSRGKDIPGESRVKRL